MICKSSGTLCSLPNNPQLSHTCPPGDWGQGLPSLHISCLQKRKRVSSSSARERASTSRLRLQAHRLVCVQVCTRVASSSSTDTLTTSPLTHVRARVLARLAHQTLTTSPALHVSIGTALLSLTPTPSPRIPCDPPTPSLYTLQALLDASAP